MSKRPFVPAKQIRVGLTPIEAGALVDALAFLDYPNEMLEEGVVIHLDRREAQPARRAHAKLGAALIHYKEAKVRR